MSPPLPIDVLQMILEVLDDRDTLVHCCLASKLLLTLSRPLLYDQVTIELDSHTEQVAQGIYEAVPKILTGSHEMVQRFEGHAHLANLVQHVSISLVCASDERDSEYIGGAALIFEKIVRALPNLNSISFVNSIHLKGFDTSIAESQLNGTSFSSIHINHSYPTIEQTLTAVYASLDVSASSLTLESPFASVCPKLTSLKVWCGYAFDSYLTLSNLDHLRRLEFYTPAIRPRRSTGGPPRWPPSRYKAIHIELSHLTALREVVFSGDRHPSVDLLRNPDRLFSSIPPGVTTLSIQRREVRAGYLSRALQSLSPSSGIRTMELHASAEGLSEVQVECKKRGIRLVLI